MSIGVRRDERKTSCPERLVHKTGVGHRGAARLPVHLVQDSRVSENEPGDGDRDRVIGVADRYPDSRLESSIPKHNPIFYNDLHQVRRAFCVDKARFMLHNNMLRVSEDTVDISEG